MAGFRRSSSNRENKWLQELKTFWLSLLSPSTTYHGNPAVIKSGEVDWIELPEQQNWFNNDDVGNRLLVRSCYKQLWSILLARQREYEAGQAATAKARWLPRQFYILGSPGVGKGIFIYYLMYQIRKHYPQAKVFCHFFQDQCYYFADDEVYEDTLENARWILKRQDNRDSQLWYLVDNATPFVLDYAFTVLLALPEQRQLYYRMWKKYSTALYMNVWGLDEMLMAKRLLNINISDEILRQNYSYVGGNIRWALLRHQWDDEHHAKEFVQRAIYRSKIKDIVATEGRTDKRDGIDEDVMHIIVKDDGTCRTCVYRYASAFIKAEVLRLYRQRYAYRYQQYHNIGMAVEEEEKEKKEEGQRAPSANRRSRKNRRR